MIFDYLITFPYDYKKVYIRFTHCLPFVYHSIGYTLRKMYNSFAFRIMRPLSTLKPLYKTFITELSSALYIPHSSVYMNIFLIHSFLPTLHTQIKLLYILKRTHWWTWCVSWLHFLVHFILWHLLLCLVSVCECRLGVDYRTKYMRTALGLVLLPI